MEKEPIEYLMIYGTVDKGSKLLPPTFVLPKGDWWLIKGTRQNISSSVCCDFEGYPLNTLSLNEIKAIGLILNEPMNTLWVYGYERTNGTSNKYKRSLIDLTSLKSYYVVSKSGRIITPEEINQLSSTQKSFDIDISG